MAALQFVHVPGYAALILRKDTQRLQLAGGLIPRSHEWLAPQGVRWHACARRWEFETKGAPASITFGFIKHSLDRFRYGSSEFQYIAFDELTEFAEDDYLFLFSRLRRRVSIEAPLRMRSASNPGNLGHDWVLRRFIPGEAIHQQLASDAVPPVFWKQGIAYVPALIRDNPAVDEAEYRDSLSHLPPVIRERLMHGDWSIREEGLLKSEWLQRFDTCDRRISLLDEAGKSFAQFDERDCRRFVTIDPAGTSADKARERRGKPASWTVIQVWDQPGGKWSHFLLLRHVARAQVGFDGLQALLRAVYQQWSPAQMWIENEKLGQAAVDVLGRELPLSTIATAGQDKVARAARLISKMERGEIRLPREPLSWLAALEAEWLRWTGDRDEVSDQIDAAAYAAMVSEEQRQRTVRLL